MSEKRLFAAGASSLALLAAPYAEAQSLNPTVPQETPYINLQDPCHEEANSNASLISLASAVLNEIDPVTYSIDPVEEHREVIEELVRRTRNCSNRKLSNAVNLLWDQMGRSSESEEDKWRTGVISLLVEAQRAHFPELVGRIEVVNPDN